MPFKRRSSYTLTLAIVAATPLFFHVAEGYAQESHAETPNKDEMLWNCQMAGGKDWECDLNPSLQTPAESAASAQPATAPVVNSAVDAAHESPSPATKLPTTGEASQQITDAPRAAANHQPPANAAWNCEADGQGGWACQTGSAQLSHSAHSTPSADVLTETVSDSLSSGSDRLSTGTEATTLRTATQSPYAHLDWYPYVTKTDQACQGQYVEPDLPQGAEGEALLIDAGQSQTRLGGLTSLQGNVLMRQEGRSLRSDTAELDQVSRIATLKGGIKYREPGLLLTGESAQTNIDTRETVFTQAEYVLHEPQLRGSADRIIRLQDSRIRLENGAYTACPPGDSSWRIAASSLTLNPNSGFGEARHARLEVADTPILYLPYFYFPISDQRLSGFLYPSVGYSDSEGLDLATPYYFNLAANYDDTLTPHIFSERGLLLENEFRHLNRYGQQTLSTGYLFNDEKTGQDRWLLGLDHTGKRGPWSSTVDFTAVSDNQYFDDLGTSLEVDRESHLNKKAQVVYQQPSWSVTTTAHSFQTIDNNKSPYRLMPQVALQGIEDTLPGDLELDYLAEATHFDRDTDGLVGVDRVTGNRLHLQPSLSLPLLWPWAYVTPRASYWLTQYNLDEQLAGKEEQITRGTGVLSIDSGLTFERQVEYGATRFSQTLEPRAFLLYVPEEEQSAIPDFDTSAAEFSYSSLFRENRFNGRDKIGDAQQLSLGISSAFYEMDGFERARLNLGQAFYFEDRRVNLNGVTTIDTRSQSNYAAEATWNINKDLRISLDTELARNDLKAEESNLKVSYAPSLNKQLNFSYRHREDVRQQTDLSFIWPINLRWNMLGHWQEDLENNQTPEALLGLEYASCCWKVRFAARRWIEDDTLGTQDQALYLQFILKGLGALGNGGSGAFNDIIGFKEREENDDY